jgi:IS1 family transposase
LLAMLLKKKHIRRVNRLSIEKQKLILQCLLEGCSIRATTRIADASKGAVTKLFLDVAEASAKYQDEHLVNLPCKRIQVDELWSFCYAKDKNVPPQHKGKEGYGDVWTWTAIDPDSKLGVCWMVGNRDKWTARKFMNKLSKRLKHRIQLSSDGFHVYGTVVEGAFAEKGVHYAMLVKQYKEVGKSSRYAGAEKRVVLGNPDPQHISTSLVERQNLTIRMHNRRFTRKTNAHSKKLENHKLSVALHFMYYNFAKIHETLRVTPAMEAGIADHVWTLEEMLALVPPPPKQTRRKKK